MAEERFKQVLGVFILLIKDGQIFLHRRKNTDWQDGTYSIIGGHVEQGESATHAAIREAKEEAGVEIEEKDLKFFNVTHLISNTERVHLAFEVNRWNGEPHNNELTKSDDAGWYPLNNLPDNTNLVSKEIIRAYLEKIPYFEMGWK